MWRKEAEENQGMIETTVSLEYNEKSVRSDNTEGQAGRGKAWPIKGLLPRALQIFTTHNLSMVTLSS